MFKTKSCLTLEEFFYLRDISLKEKQSGKAYTNSCLENRYGHPFKYNDDSFFVAKKGGIKNNGNTCYIGSTIQCINVIRPFLKYLIESFAENEILYIKGNRHNLYKAYVEWLYKGINCNMDKLTIDENDRLRKVFFSEIDSERQFLNQFKSGGQEQDADEFLIKFFNYLDNAVNEINFIRNVVIEKNKQLSTQFDNYIAINKLDNSVSRIFFGIKSQLKFKCLEQLSHPLEIRIEDRMETKINLEIENLKSLNECMRSYCNSNIFKFCEFCKKDVFFSLKRLFEILSDFLIITLKRFKVILISYLFFF